MTVKETATAEGLIPGSVWSKAARPWTSNSEGTKVAVQATPTLSNAGVVHSKAVRGPAWSSGFIPLVANIHSSRSCRDFPFADFEAPLYRDLGPIQNLAGVGITARRDAYVVMSINLNRSGGMAGGMVTLA